MKETCPALSLNGAGDRLEIAWRGTSHAVLVFVHAHSVMDNLRKLTLLLRRKRLVESRHCLGMRGGLLRRKIADGAGNLVNRSSVIVLYGCVQVLMGGAHLLMNRFTVIHNLCKKGGGLLLLLRRQ